MINRVKLIREVPRGWTIGYFGWTIKMRQLFLPGKQSAGWGCLQVPPFPIHAHFILHCVCEYTTSPVLTVTALPRCVDTHLSKWNCVQIDDFHLWKKKLKAWGNYSRILFHLTILMHKVKKSIRKNSSLFPRFEMVKYKKDIKNGQSADIKNSFIGFLII